LCSGAAAAVFLDIKFIRTAQELVAKYQQQQQLRAAAVESVNQSILVGRPVQLSR